MSGHTKGPWSYDLARTQQYQIDIKVGADCLATVYGSFGENLQNARLIAVAPELLDDLCEASATLRRYEALHRAKNTEESTAKAEVNAELAARFEATIAKAKGEA